MEKKHTRKENYEHKNIYTHNRSYYIIITQPKIRIKVIQKQVLFYRKEILSMALDFAVPFDIV